MELRKRLIALAGLWLDCARTIVPDRGFIGVSMRMVSHSGREAITGKLIRAERLRMQTALKLLVFSGVIRLANVEPPSRKGFRIMLLASFDW